MFEAGYWLAGLKCTLGVLGWNVGAPSRPIPPFDARQRAVVEALVSAGNRRWLTLPAVGSGRGGPRH